MPLTPAQRRLRARIGGLALASQRDPAAYTAAARRSFMARFEREVDPEGVLPPGERQRRAAAAKRAYFAKLALKRMTGSSGKKKATATTVARGEEADGANPIPG